MHEAILHCHGIKTWRGRWANGEPVHMVRAHGTMTLQDGTELRGPFAVRQDLPIDYGHWRVSFEEGDYLGGNGVRIVSIQPVEVSK